MAFFLPPRLTSNESSEPASIGSAALIMCTTVDRSTLGCARGEPEERKERDKPDDQRQPKIGGSNIPSVCNKTRNEVRAVANESVFLFFLFSLFIFFSQIVRYFGNEQVQFFAYFKFYLEKRGNEKKKKDALASNAPKRHTCA